MLPKTIEGLKGISALNAPNLFLFSSNSTDCLTP